MESALTVMAIFSFSTIVVRIASTIMRLTGLPDNVARFQSLSALTGTGFTTRESELIVNYPIRRRVLMTLMILGNLGLISITSTFIVTFSHIASTDSQFLEQAALFAGALVLNFLLLTHPKVDQWICQIIGKVLQTSTSLGDRTFVRLLSLEEHLTIAEHHLRIGKPVTVAQVFPDGIELSLLLVRGEQSRSISELDPDSVIQPFEVAVCFGTEDMHAKFANWLETHDALAGRE